MKRPIFLAAAALALIAALPVAAAGSDGASLPQAERDRLTALIERAVSAGRAEVERPDWDRYLSPEDRRNARSQFALLLYSADDCAGATLFIREHGDIRATGIERLVYLAILERKRQCAVGLAPLLLERWDDPAVTPAQRIAYRFEAGALLDSAAIPAGRDAMNAAEAEMLEIKDPEVIWNARVGALIGYDGSPMLNRYLDYLADHMVADPASEPYQKRRSIFITFAADGRCDLIERVTGGGPASCIKPKADVDSLYVHPSPSLAADAAHMEKMLTPPAPKLDDDGIRAALAAPTPWARLTALMFLIDDCQERLGQGARPAG